MTNSPDAAKNFPDAAGRFLREWISPPNRLAILVGAGVSIDPPTFMPSAGDLIKIIINSITTPESPSWSELMHFTNPQRNERRSLEDYIRLERILQILWDRDPRALDTLRFFAESSLPNRHHYALAILAAAG